MVVLTKQEILEATLELACEKGLGNLSMSMIADRVHLKKSSLYSHFRSKEELIQCMYESFREQAKIQRGLSEIDYDLLFEGHSLYEILLEAVGNYRRISRSSAMEKFYRLILSERAYDPTAAMILIEETRRMIQATKNLFYALMAKRIISFEDPDAAAFSFAMGVHAVMDYEADAERTGVKDAEGRMEQYIWEFCRIYEASDAQKGTKRYP